MLNGGEFPKLVKLFLTFSVYLINLFFHFGFPIYSWRRKMFFTDYPLAKHIYCGWLNGISNKT